MRFFLVTLFFFFAPVIVMFALRHLFWLLRLWLKWKQRQQVEDAQIIDITPKKPAPASKWFIVLAVLVGIACASLVWKRLNEPAQPAGGVYVPAHVNSAGQLVPGHFSKP